MWKSIPLYMVLAPLNMLMIVFVFLTAPFWAGLTVIMGWKNLPGILIWLQTTDNDIDGLQLEKPDLNRDARGLELMWQRTQWLWRNPAWGFAAQVLGVPAEGTALVWLGGNGKSMGGREFAWFTYKLVTSEGKEYFGIRMNLHLWNDRTFKIWFGWNPYAYDGKYHSLRLEFQGNKART